MVKIPLFALVVCMSLVVVVPEVVAAAHLVHHDCTGEKDSCPVCRQVKAAADFLDNLKLTSFLAAFSVFLMFLAQIIVLFIENIPCLFTLIALKVRINP